MAQPIKKQTVNSPSNYFSKELTTLIDYITKEVLPLFGITEITPDIFIYSALDNSDCMLYKSLNSFLNSFDITSIHDGIGENFLKTNGVINGKVDFSKEMNALFTTAYELKELTNSEYITSDHILLAILSGHNESIIPKIKHLVKMFKNVGVNYDVMLELSQKTHDVITNDVPSMSNEDVSDLIIDEDGTTIRVYGLSFTDIPQTLQNLTEQIGSKKKGNNKKQNKNLDFCTNLNKLYKNNEIDNLVGRERELQNIYNILARRKRNNALLIGESGVGKTQCVLGLVKEICDGVAPLQFRNKEIWKLNPAELIAGTQLRGQFEERIVTLTKQLKDNKNIILFIDDIDKIFGNKTTNSDYDAGGILSELFANGTTQIIATTTTKKYKTIVDNNPDVADKFQDIIIEKPSLNDCYEILRQSKISYEKFHNVKYSDDIIYQIVNLCDRYIINKQLPSSAFDVIDELGSYKKINSEDNLEIKYFLQQIHELEKVKDSHIKKDNIEEANDVENKINEFRDKIAKIQSNTNKRSAQNITPDDLYHVISEQTHIPINKITTSEKEELKHISDTLKKVVIGQDEVIDIISRAIKRNKIGITSTMKPRLSVLCIGQSGVGKTLIAKTLAKEIFGDEKYLVRFDMSEYSDETSVNKLIGSNAGYVGYTEGGLLTEAIKAKKYCVLLIDEIEKAHNKVYNLFLQILDEGFLTDNTGCKVDFRNTIIIMTSNVGAKKAANTRGIGFASDNALIKEDVLRKELKNEFPPEFLNRIDDIVYFNSLTDDNLKKIIKLELGYLKKRVNNINYDINFDDTVIDLIFNDVIAEKEYGARPINRVIRSKIENNLTDLLVENDYPIGYEFKVNVDEEKGLEIF